MKNRKYINNFFLSYKYFSSVVLKKQIKLKNKQKENCFLYQDKINLIKEQIKFKYFLSGNLKSKIKLKLKKKSNNTYKSEIDLLKEPKKINRKRKIKINKRDSVCIRIHISSNNIFCTLWSLKNGRTFRTRSAGMKQLNVSKKRIFFGAKIIIQSFIKEISIWKKKYRNKFSLSFYSISAPKNLRKFILKSILKSATLINIEYKKPFNGCKAKKRRRKKRLGFRSFK